MSNLRRQTLIQKWSPLNLFGREHRLPNLHFGGPTCSSSFWGYSFIRRWFWPFNHNTNGGEKNTNQLKLPQPLDLSHPIVQFPPVSVPPPLHLLMVLIKIQLHRLFQNTITSRVVVYLVGPMSSSAESWKLGQKPLENWLFRMCQLDPQQH